MAFQKASIHWVTQRCSCSSHSIGDPPDSSTTDPAIPGFKRPGEAMACAQGAGRDL